MRHRGQFFVPLASFMLASIFLFPPAMAALGPPNNVCVNETGFCWTGVQETINNATSGQTVVIINATEYNESVVVNVTGLRLTTNATSRPVIFFRAGAPTMNITVDNVTISSIAIIYNGSSSGLYALTARSVKNLTIVDNIVNNTGSGDGAAMYITLSVIVNISNNTVNTRVGLSEYGIHINQTSNATIFNNSIYTNGGTGSDGIVVYFRPSYSGHSDNLTITWNTITARGSNPTAGINITIGSNDTIANNSIFTNNGYGIELDTVAFTSRYGTIANNFINSTSGGGIYVAGAHSNNFITNNTIYTTVTGISIYSVTNVVKWNYVKGDGDNSGFYIATGASGNTLSNNTAVRVSYGFSVNTVNGNTIRNNTAANSTYGFYLDSSNYTSVVDNIALNSINSGIYLNGVSRGNNVSENAVQNSTQNGIYVSSGSTNNTLLKNTASNNLFGFYILTGDIKLQFNRAENSTTGFGFSNAANGTFINNTAVSNQDGFYLSSSTNMTFVNSTASQNSLTGFYFSESNQSLVMQSDITSNVLIGVFVCGVNGLNVSSTRISSSTLGVAVGTNDLLSCGMESNNTYIISSVISAQTDIYVRGTTLSGKPFALALNSTFDRAKINISVNSTFYNQHYLDVYVRNSSGSPFNQASVNITDSGSYTSLNPTPRFNGLTNSSGYISTQILTEFMANETNTTPSSFFYFSLYTARASNVTLQSAPSTVNLTSGSFLNITLIQQALDWSSNSTSSTEASATTALSASWTSNIGLSGYIFSIDNGMGSFTNQSFSSFSGLSNTSTLQVVITSTVGATFRWKVFVNDSNNKWNTTDTFQFTTIAPPPTTTTTLGGGGGGGGGGGAAPSSSPTTTITLALSQSIDTSIKSVEKSGAANETFSGSFILTNLRNSSINVTISASGSIAPLIKIETSRLTVSSGSNGEVKYTFNAPEGTAPGVYEGNIVISGPGFVRTIPVSMRILSSAENTSEENGGTIKSSVTPGQSVNAPVIVAALLGGLYAAYQLSRQLFKNATKKKEDILKEKQLRSIYPFPDFSLLPKGNGNLWLGKIVDADEKSFIDFNKLTQHTLVVGASGSGKSVSSMVIVEEVLDKGIPVVVFDPTAQWSGFFKPCTDEKMLSLYGKFGMNSPKAYKGKREVISDPNAEYDLEKLREEGGLTIFDVHKLSPESLDHFIEGMLSQPFMKETNESSSIRLLIVIDEVHRLLPKYGGKKAHLKLESAVREFRKWGMGILLISQVMTDFKSAIRGNMGTEIQMRTKYEGDVKRIADKYGKTHSRLIPALPPGVGMFQFPEYNNGKPYFIQFRPIYHDVTKMQDNNNEKNT